MVPNPAPSDALHFLSDAFTLLWTTPAQTMLSGAVCLCADVHIDGIVPRQMAMDDKRFMLVSWIPKGAVPQLTSTQQWNRPDLRLDCLNAGVIRLRNLVRP